ncbi:exodeoxyribonuclease VII large subunit [Jeongeupia naejangsanensis]|uniref:Exodeoxyribonuclease 7 large subunit n=1 Tax=Jeongeupia naejangsanensis TaxID=613195 RepID=A0ABS2BRY1_9NEIS|nr:exodeoxyribonuclease VII large subunit [Jeongeupia naejangsanensis]MBM3117741.1 exodeoxyribonuclease VII large subunit [Jeongeupia naejangsanensis]
MFSQKSSANVITVTELNRQVRDLLEGSFPIRWIAGEISNFKRYDSGHCYFSLKDAGAQVRCVMFRNRAALLDFQPKEGLQVEVRAVVSLYEARGDYQLTIEAMRPAGVGNLFEAFEALKKKLAAEGLFDAATKRALPAFPRAIGIVTSPKAAALRDVLTTLRRRHPGLPVIIYPTAVQGTTAANDIAAAIRNAAKRNEVDTLIVCRGGGSLEDLWSFNEEVVARAIAASPMPVVSGVGHETDFTIADFVADVRAPTPTAAAELASPNRDEWLMRLDQQAARLKRELERGIHSRMQLVDQLGRRLRHPGDALAQRRDRLASLMLRLSQASSRQLADRHARLERLALRLTHRQPQIAPHTQRLAELQRRLAQAAARSGETGQRRLDPLAARLAALNPHAVLSRGYVLVERPDGRVVQNAGELARGDQVALHFADDRVDAQILGRPAQQQDLF